MSKSLASRSGATTRAVEQRPSPVADVCFARQPVFSGAGDVAGYELLYRTAPIDTAATNSDGSVMPADVMVHTFINIGLDQLASGRPAFMKFTREMLLGRVYARMPSSSVVIELFEDVQPDEEIESACEDLVDAGYALALDAFVWSPEYRRLLELATIVKIDVLNQSPAKLDEVAQRLAPYDVRLLAERIETMEVRAMCAGLGYQLFQGCYYTRAEMIVKRALKSDELAIVQAMNVIHAPATTDAEAEAVFSDGLGLSCKLLRMANSAAHGGRGMESIRQALRLSGRSELGKWLAVLLVSSMAARGGTHRELLHLAVQRGRMCELLARTTGRGRDSGALFLVGLLSLLDAVSGVPMYELLEVVTLAPALREALIARTGPYAGPLRLTEAYERGEWTAVSRDAASTGVEPSQLTALYVQSLAWTRERLRSVAAA